MFLPQHDNNCLVVTASTYFFSFVKYFNEKIMYPAIYRVVSSLSWLIGYDSSATSTLTCLQHSLLLLCKLFRRKISSRLPYNTWANMSEHILTPIFSQKLFQFFLLSGSRLCCRNNRNIISLSTHFVSVKLTNLKNWLVKSWLYSWSTYPLSFACPKILLALHTTVFPGSPKALKISSWNSRNIFWAKVYCHENGFHSCKRI